MERIVLTREQLRFEILRGFQQIPRAHWRTFDGQDAVKAERSREAMVDLVLTRFDDLEVSRELDRRALDFREMGKGSSKPAAP